MLFEERAEIAETRYQPLLILAFYRLHQGSHLAWSCTGKSRSAWTLASFVEIPLR
jgi:hypothetical protein